MRTDDRPLPFAGTDEELKKYLLEFAAASGAWGGRDSRRGEWLLDSGAFLSSNPNTAPHRIRISRSEGGLVLKAQLRALPWTRSKRTRLVDHRLGQLADYLTARVRGSGPEKFSTLPLREPFAPFGSGVAALTASFTWSVLTALVVFAAALLALTLGSVPLMTQSIRDIAAHSHALVQAGAIPLPRLEEAAATGPWMPAVVFAVPIAFFLALVHGAALLSCDLGRRMARMPQASVLFQAILLGLAFFPYSWALSVLVAAGVPAAVHLGSTIVWSRRRERIREGPRPAKAVILIAVALSASLAGAVVPRATEWKGALDRIALFRDSWLLGNPVGAAIARAYYRSTLYTAEPLKEIYSKDDQRSRLAQVIAECGDPQTIPLLRALRFTVVPPGRVHQVEVGQSVRCQSVSVPRKSPDQLEDLEEALDQVSRDTFRGARLRELSALGWHALYYAGPLALLLVAMGALAPFISILFRKLRPPAALFALSACAIVTSLSLVLATSPRDPSPDLAEDLADARPAVRHEAAFRASQLESTAALADALLKAADDADLTVRLWAVAALGKSGDPRAFPKLVERLEDPELFVRYRAAEGLGALKDARAIGPLVRVMRERSWYEGSYALDSLRRIQPGMY
ncbi:MAG TPA: HEAT repeat domain-containing protein [Planctomycetota bacterium]|nr:HEAT repeat domain-containing protein [Planctomycetota bacterium]